MASHLYLADEGVINFNSGNVTLTHSTDTLTISEALTVSGKLTLTQTTATLSGDRAIDFSDSSDFYYTLSNNVSITMTAPTNETAGQQGTITFKTGSSGTNTVNWATGSKWFFEGGTAPTISQETGVYDVFSYYVVASSIILITGASTFKQHT